MESKGDQTIRKECKTELGRVPGATITFSKKPWCWRRRAAEGKGPEMFCHASGQELTKCHLKWNMS